MAQGEHRGGATVGPRASPPAPGRRGRASQASRWLAALALLFGLLAGLVLPGEAASTSLRLRVNGEASYDPHTQWLVATDVHFGHGAITIEAQALEADLARQEALFTGQVRLETESGHWQGAWLTYNLATGAFVLGEGEAELQPAGASGSLRLQAPRVEGTVAHIHIGGATLTTCGLDHPEYHVRAREIEIWPGEVMVLRHVVYVEGAIPLLYWPRVTISLDPDDEMGTSPFQPPEVGWTEEDGWYIRMAYAYDTRADRLGLLHVGYHQFSGWGLGVTQRVPLGPASWTVGADWLQNPPSEVKGREEAEPRYRLRTRIDLPAAANWPVEAVYAGTYWETRPASTSQRADWALEHDLALTYRQDGTSVGVRGHQERGREEGEALLKEGADLSLGQELGPLRLSAGTQGRRWQKGADLHQYMGYQGVVEGRWGSWDAALRGGWTLHSQILQYKIPGTNAWTRFGRAPEGELGYTLPARLWSQPLQGTRLRLFTQAGRYQEERADGPTGWLEGAHLGFRSSGTRLPLAGSWSLGLSTWAGQWWYETAEELLYAGSTWTLQYRPSAAFTGELRYTIQDAWGETPFHAHTEAWKARERLELLLEARRGALWAGTFARYDLLEDELTDLAGLVQVSLGEKVTVGAAGHYDVPDQTWTRYDAILALPLGERWAVQGEVAYALDEDETTLGALLGQLSLTYTSDCRTVGLRFDVVNKAIWLEYHLNAFPTTPLQLGWEAEASSLFQLPNMRAVVQEVTS